jgi:parallel beta-helix repeat protein
MKHKFILSAIHVCLIVVLIFAFVLLLETQPVKAVMNGPIYIRANGSVDPPSAPISSIDNVTYTLTSDITNSTIVQRDNIILDGGGHKIQGGGFTFSKGVGLWGRKNVTVRNVVIKSFYYGIDIEYSAMNDRILGCSIANNTYAGVYVGSSSGINVTGNIFSHNVAGVTLASSSNNVIRANTFVGDGLYVSDSYGNVVDGNVANGKPLVYLEKVSNRNVTDAGQVILVNCSSIRVENLDLSDTVVGLEMWGTTDSRIVNNTITNSDNSIWLYGDASHNLISENSIMNSGTSGIYLAFSSSNNITANMVLNAQYDGIALESSSDHNRVIGNDVKNNREYGISVVGSSNNVIYHNSFVNNTQQAHVASPPGISNVWNSSYPSGGNYWSNYNGTDANSDALGNTPYTIDADNRDNQPLMGMFNTFNAGTWNGTQYNMNIISKSTLSNFNFNPANRTLNFTVTGQTGTQSFCRVDIPKALMWTDNPSQWTIKVGGNLTPADRIIETSDTSYIHFTYTHSTKTVQIQSTHAIPENISSIVLIALLTITLALSAIYKRKRKDA